MAYCPQAPGSLAALQRGTREAQLFASLFPQTDTDDAVAADSSDEEGEGDDEDDADGGAEAEPIAVAGASGDAMDLDPAPKAVKQRKSYSVKYKVNIIKKYDAVRQAMVQKDSEANVTQLRVLTVIKLNTGVPVKTALKWLLKRDAIISRFDDKKRHVRKKKRIGSGRKPRFPLAEAAVARLVRERRSKSLVVTKRWVIKTFKAEAAVENQHLADLCKFSSDMIFAFFRRSGLALRLPSCTKAMSLEAGVLAGRGWLRWLLKLVTDTFEDGVKYAARMHEVQGRFLFTCRMNEDEVRASQPCSSTNRFLSSLVSRGASSLHAASGRRTYVLSRAGAIGLRRWCSALRPLARCSMSCSSSGARARLCLLLSLKLTKICLT
jgi:hypothetical protein